MDNKKGVIAAAIALVIVLAGAGFGYGVLRSRGMAASGNAVTSAADVGEDTANDVATTPGESTDDAATSNKVNESNAGTANGDEAASERDVAYLADYDATVYDEANNAVRMTAIADGKPLVINFWATWCPYCVQEMPDFQQVMREYGDQVSFAFVDATDGQRERKEDAQAWLADNGFGELPAYYDLDSDAIQTFGIYAFPTTIVVDADGQIVGMAPGAIDAERLRSALEDLV